jgi:hypothetical protein
MREKESIISQKIRRPNPIHRIAARGRTRALESVLPPEIPDRFCPGSAVPFHAHAVIWFARI